MKPMRVATLAKAIERDTLAPAIPINADWRISADNLQWILQRRRMNGWRPVSFVSSTKEILARCMKEKGVPPEVAQRALGGLPNTFSEWRTGHSLPANEWRERRLELDTATITAPPLVPDVPATKTHPSSLPVAAPAEFAGAPHQASVGHTPKRLAS
jgi:hypothetical protein